VSSFELFKLILPLYLFKLALMHFGVLIVKLCLRFNVSLFLLLLQFCDFSFKQLLSSNSFRFVLLHKSDLSFAGLKLFISELELISCLVVVVLFILKLILQ